MQGGLFIIILICVCLVVLVVIDIFAVAVVIYSIANHDCDFVYLRIALLGILLTVSFAFILFDVLSGPPETIERYGHTYILETEQPKEVESE